MQSSSTSPGKTAALTVLRPPTMVPQTDDLVAEILRARRHRKGAACAALFDEQY